MVIVGGERSSGMVEFGGRGSREVGGGTVGRWRSVAQRVYVICRMMIVVDVVVVKFLLFRW